MGQSGSILIRVKLDLFVIFFLLLAEVLLFKQSLIWFFHLIALKIFEYTIIVVFFENLNTEIDISLE